MKVKKLVLKTSVAICCLGIVFGGIAGCTQKSDNGNRGSSGSEKITYSFFKNQAVIQGYPEDGGPAKQVILAAMEKAGIKNVDYKVMVASGDEYFNRLNLLAASNDLPDFFDTNYINMTKFADNGYIIPLDEIVEKHPNIKNVLLEKDLEVCRYDGKLWAIPNGTLPGEFNGNNGAGLMIRKDWLDNLGLDMPETIDDFYNVLKAFTFNDPNRSGSNDTYAIGSSLDDFASLIYGAYGIVPNFWHEVDGGLKQGWVLPETKEALALLHKWYKEGLIDKDFVITQKKQVEEKFMNSRVGMIAAGPLDINKDAVVPTGLRQAVPDSEISMVILLEGPNGHRVAPEGQPGRHIRCISSNAKNPELLAKILEWSADEGPNGGFFLLTYGLEEQHYNYDKESDRVRTIVPASGLYREGYGNPVRFLPVTDRRWITNEEALDLLSEQNREGNYIKNKFWGSVPAMIDYPDLVASGGARAKLWTDYQIKIIVGEASIDAFDEFVEKYYQMGGKEIEAQVNEAYKKNAK